jgi:hypothetical protein
MNSDLLFIASAIAEIRTGLAFLIEPAFIARMFSGE